MRFQQSDIVSLHIKISAATLKTLKTTFRATAACCLRYQRETIKYDTGSSILQQIYELKDGNSGLG